MCLIDVNAARDAIKSIGKQVKTAEGMRIAVLMALCDAPTVDAVEVPDKKLLRAVKLLIRQYERSKQSDFVHNPIAHAFYHTWKELDESGYGERRDK